VNDTLGNVAGDEVLKEAAERIGSAVAPFAGDTPIGPWRLGGNEFAILLPSGAAETAAQHVLTALSRPFAVSGREMSLGVRIGVAPDIASCGSASAAIRSCDLALRHAKQRPGSTCAIYDSSMDEPVLRRHAMEQRLRAAIDSDALRVVYQPRVSARSGRITGFEALLRWTDAEFGAVPPAEFIQLAEETRMIVPLGERLLRTALSQLARWRSSLGADRMRISVNVSQVQLGAGFVELVKAVVAEQGLEPRCVELEITETALMQDEGGARDALARLRAFGVRTALDDFGSGYSSLGMLRRLPIDVLKMDRAFVSALGEDSDAEAVAVAVVALARVYGLDVVAEGVETREQRDLLAALGCDELQGFLFSPPLAVEDATQALESGAFAARRKSTRAGKR
jgi:diguanylate cyclase (GGDEF)-like protein